MRAKQFAARGEAVMDFVREYVGDTILPAIDDVTSAMLEKRGADLKRFTGMKTAVVEKLKTKGTVPVTRATAEIDKQIAALKKDIAKSTGEAKSAHEKNMKELQAKRKVAQAELGKMQKSAASTWDATKEGFSDAYQDLHQSVEKAVSAAKSK